MGGGVSLDRLHAFVQREHDRRPRVHRPGGADLRQVAPLRRIRCRVPVLRLLDRARGAAVRRTSTPGRPTARSSSALPYLLTLVAVAGRRRPDRPTRRGRPPVRPSSSVASESQPGAAWAAIRSPGIASVVDASRWPSTSRAAATRTSLLHAGFRDPRWPSRPRRRSRSCSPGEPAAAPPSRLAAGERHCVSRPPAASSGSSACAWPQSALVALGV